VAVDIQFQPKRGLDGVLTIRAEGQPDVTIDDELWHQLMQLPRALADVVTGATRYASVPYSSQPGAFEITPEGADLVLTGEYIATARYPREDFVRAVLAAADRWLAHAAKVGDPDHAAVAPDVESAIGEARTALSS
jgi:hypothetical protein